MNALLHMWGYVSDRAPGAERPAEDPARLIDEILKRSLRQDARYLLESTALSDLSFWAQRHRGTDRRSE